MHLSNTLRSRTEATPRPRTARDGRSDEAYYTKTRELFKRLHNAEDHYERDVIYRELVELHTPVVRR
ncbi:hypothetical protein, partial [Allosalinactinospora lopnorensis]|uniref:hypothetical protein n=1 Tax=Allosalinactinospora lopnorensis TaxID=1352348 RepID=UPI000623C270